MKIFITLLLTVIVSFFAYYFYFKYSFLNNLSANSEIVETSLGSVEYTLKGNNGPVLLFIHGTPGGYDQTTDATEKFRVLTPSRPGFLRTSIRLGKTPFEQAKVFKALIDALGIDKVIVMGVSGGGPSSLEFAAHFPENTYGLIAFEAVSYADDFAETDSETIGTSDFGLWIQLFSMSFMSNESIASAILPNQQNRNKLVADPKNIEKLKELIWSVWPLSARKDGIKNDYEQFTNISLPLNDIKIPTLVIHGDEDVSVDISHANELIKKIRGAKLYTVKGGDHYMSLTHAEEIEPLIEKFVLQYSNQ
ncbi:alpha/beta fold hydrolase [Colwellia hornerae]|uniref:Alpha/beta hydrolase n=1 Tax=Colwellia hornerae TaxID=89402 RepID=A0A5C6Q274_9GAMM|nr:alpha/beta hydrolase [Colwellia hornerae]TWX45547.1 alpha/beta hydrolase [Colwellia hornerae]TWX53519.1 alpha/beta hydrolase [Colwellia hornerae]TWX62712.1 alpha/beta hydrolase [Colwellia hornerae]